MPAGPAHSPHSPVENATRSSHSHTSSGVVASRVPRAILIALAGLLASIAPEIFSSSGRVMIFLPGTQPGTSDTIPAGGAARCQSCHTASPGNTISHYRDWSGSMMAQSARDPIFRAALAVSNKYSGFSGQNYGEYCIRCHSPTGWLAGRSEDISGGSLYGTDLDGIQCEFCHRLVDPIHPDSSAPPMVYPVPGYGNGMVLLQRLIEPVRGPRDPEFAPHLAAADTFQSKSELCGACHDVSNPFQTEGQERIDLPPHAYAPVERTYSEWLMSAFASEGDSGTCQACHMAPAPGRNASAGPVRADIAVHDLTGGNSFVPRILHEFWDGLDTVALARGAGRAEATLRRAARLELAATVPADDTSGGGGTDSVTARATIVNLTGHKLPTGYPEGRRMWLSVYGFGAAGDTLYRSGHYDIAGAEIDGSPVPVVYEAVRGLTPEAAAANALLPGPSFHFALNDTTLSDNRIPPRGFTNAGFASRGAAPVGVAYADGQYSDTSEFIMPAEVKRVEARLLYQTISREYVEFLRDENVGNPYDAYGWGDSLHAVWARRGKSAPVTMDSIGVDVIVTAAEDLPGMDGPRGEPDAPAALMAHPNPFNSTVTLTFDGSSGANATVVIYDMTGRTVAVLGAGDQESAGGAGRGRDGSAGITWHPGDLPSGTYIARAAAGGRFLTTKLLLIR